MDVEIRNDRNVSAKPQVTAALSQCKRSYLEEELESDVTVFIHPEGRRVPVWFGKLFYETSLKRPFDNKLSL